MRSILQPLSVTLFYLCLGITPQAFSDTTIQLSSGNRQVSLLEVYSSQGCSSCPPAERWISQLKKDPRLWKRFIPLVFHVDYWDDLGWVDAYSSADYSNRQYEHKQQENIRSVYTPGFILAGKEWRQWFSRSWHQKKQTPRFSRKKTGLLTAEINSNNITVNFQSKQEEPLTLQIAILGFDVKTPISAGENKGLILTQDFVVLAQQQYINKEHTWQVPLPSHHYKGKTGIALWVSKSGELASLQAVGGWL